MRKIKLRALVEKSGKSHPAVGGFEQYNQIIKVESITFNDDGVDLVVDENGDEYSYHDKTLLAVMEYTGLKDQNDVEIYEGDILSTDLSRPYLIVKFRNGAFMFQCHDNGKDYYDFMTSVDEDSNFTKYHKVIGNIYEHPHLLEGSK